MNEIITGFIQNTSLDKKNQNEFVLAGRILTWGGLQLDIGILSELTSSEGQTLKLPQLAVDSAIRYIEKSEKSDVAELLYNATQYANEIVYTETNDDEQLHCSLTIVAVNKAGKLFVSNIGSSRAYLINGQSVNQITIDHTFKTMMPIQGKMSPQAAQQSPESDKILLTLGSRKELPVDVGIHLYDTQDQISYIEAQNLGRDGLEIQTGDSILLAPSRINLNYFNTTTFQTLTKEAGDDAAKKIAKAMFNQGVEQDISVALLQTENIPFKSSIAALPLQVFGHPVFVITNLVLLVLMVTVIVTFISLRVFQLRLGAVPLLLGYNLLHHISSPLL